jgi:hypothetical protein
VQRCIAEGLVSADGFAVDASLIAAEANKQRSVPCREWKPEEIKPTATRAAQEYLATLDDAAFGAASPGPVRPLRSRLDRQQPRRPERPAREAPFLFDRTRRRSGTARAPFTAMMAITITPAAHQAVKASLLGTLTRHRARVPTA